MRYIYNYIITLQVTFKSIAFALLYHLLSFKQSYKQDCPQDINTGGGRGLQGYVLTPLNHKMKAFYGDWVHVKRSSSHQRYRK